MSGFAASLHKVIVHSLHLFDFCLNELINTKMLLWTMRIFLTLDYQKITIRGQENNHQIM